MSREGKTNLGIQLTLKGTPVMVVVENRKMAYRIEAFIDRKVVGEIGVYRGEGSPIVPQTPCYHVRSAEVHEDYRRRGIATLLYQIAADIAESENMALCSDMSTSLSEDAEAFWIKQSRAGSAYWEVPGNSDDNFDYGRWVLNRPPRLTL